VLWRHGVLALTPTWGEERNIVLASSFVADALRREEGCEYLPVDEALRRFEWLKRQPMSSWKVRQFVSDAGLRANLWEMNDWEVANFIRVAIERRSVCGLRKIDKAGKRVDATTEQRRLVRNIEKQTRGHLNFSGRQYKLVVDVDLGQVPGRNSYEVAGRDEALRVLDGLAKEAGAAGDLGALLVQASAKLTPDWRPPRQPDGLILLRRIRQSNTPVKDTGPAITPSQMKDILYKKRVVSIAWNAAEAWCSEDATAEGKTKNYAPGDSVEVTFQEHDGSQHQTVTTTVASDSFGARWTVTEILPVKRGGHLAPDLKMDATAEGVTSPKPLAVMFITQLNKVVHVQNRTHFELSLTDNVVLVGSEIKYVKGWGGEVVKLGNKVPAGTGGLLDGQLSWSGYRWMKSVGLGKRFWDGTAWQNLPAGFVLADSNNFAVGFYLQDTSFTCQYGGTWPEAFTDWNIDADDNRRIIAAWTNNIEKTWTGKFDLKRKECKSSDKRCCRYSTKAVVAFSKQATFSTGMLIVADGNIRSNDSLLFLGETRIAVAAHEFGHHLGNPDEYAGAAVDTSLNSDGATNGIDPDSIMGQNLTKVKARHLREICKVFTDAVTGAFGKSYHYLVVPP
jgi:hypothetical protein